MTDREIIEKIEWRGRGLPKGTVEEYFAAFETFKGFDLESAIKRINSGYHIIEKEPTND